MGSTNYGQQLITFQYNQPATSASFNRVHYKALPMGVYEGGELSKPEPTLNRVSISPGTFVFYDPTYTEQTDDSVPEAFIEGIAVKITTTSSITDIDISNSTPYITLSYTWQNVSGNYMEFNVKDFASIDTDKEIIIGRGCFVGGVLQDTFDYTRRSEPRFIVNENHKDDLKVLPDETGGNPKAVYVNSGELVLNNKLVSWDGGYSSDFSDTPSGQKRTDIVYLKEDGTLGTRLGTTAASDPQAPQYPNDGVVLAEIRREGDRTTVQGNEIYWVDFRNDVTKVPIFGPDNDEVNGDDIPIGTQIEFQNSINTTTFADSKSIRSTLSDMVNIDKQISEGTYIIDDAIKSRHIDDKQILSNHYGDNSIHSDDIDDDQIITRHYASDSIKAAAIDNNEIKDYHIDWGTGSNQVSATDMPYDGSVSASDVKDALDTLQSEKWTQSSSLSLSSLTTDTLDLSTLTVSESIDADYTTSGTGTVIFDSGNVSADNYTSSTFTIRHPMFGYILWTINGGIEGYLRELYLEVRQNGSYVVLYGREHDKSFGSATYTDAYYVNGIAISTDSNEIDIMTIETDSTSITQYGIILMPGVYRFRSEGISGESSRIRFYATGVFGDVSP